MLLNTAAVNVNTLMWNRLPFNEVSLWVIEWVRLEMQQLKLKLIERD